MLANKINHKCYYIMCYEEITFKKYHIYFFIPMKSNVMNIYGTFTVVIINKNEVRLAFFR